MMWNCVSQWHKTHIISQKTCSELNPSWQKLLKFFFSLSLFFTFYPELLSLNTMLRGHSKRASDRWMSITDIKGDPPPLLTRPGKSDFSSSRWIPVCISTHGTLKWLWIWARKLMPGEKTVIREKKISKKKKHVRKILSLFH